MNLGLVLSKAALTYKDRTALGFGSNRETYSQLDSRANSLANGLLEMGVKKGDSVAILQYNAPALMETLFACFKAGFIAVPMNARLHESEVAYIVEHSEASAIIFSPEFKDAVRSVPSHGRERLLVSVDGSGDELIPYDKVSGSTDPPKSEVTLDDVAWLFYTSGTTGRPKGAMLTHRNLLSMTINFLADVHPASEHDVALHVAPLTHGSGLYALPMLARGSANLILESRSFDPAKIFEAISRQRVTVLPFLTPTMIKLLLISPQMGGNDLSSLRCIVYGGSPMYVEDLKEAIKRFGNVFVQIYGQGEAPMTISYLSKAHHAVNSEAEDRRLGSAGIARTDVEVRIVDDDDRTVPTGKMGEIAVAGDVVMRGYLKDPKSTTEAMRNGWLHTGDVGYVDEDGFIYIMDRKKDMIISGGSNIYPRELEEVILTHPAVQEVVVIGVPDPVWGESVKAIVVRRPGAAVSEEEIIAFCKAHMASYKKPKSVEFTDSIPKNAYGKVLRREIREPYWGKSARRV